MSDEKTPTIAPSPVELTSFAELLGAAVAKGVAASQPPKKVSYGEYQRRINAGRPKLRRDSFENGFQIPEQVLSVNEITLLNKITHAGRYIDRLVEVIIRDEGLDEVVELRYNNATADQRMLRAQHMKSFEDMLQQIVAAQELERVELDEVADKKAERRRVWGNNKAMRDAEARSAK